MKKRIILLGILLTFGICSCGNKQDAGSLNATESIANEDTEQTETVTETEPEPFQEYDIELMMVGDNLLHQSIVDSGLQEDGSYNYDMLFEDIAPFLEAAEISIINQETIFGGDHLEFTGYPAFNSPTAVGDAIVKAGFDVVLFASNHVSDKGYSGMEYCIDFWEQTYPDTIITGMQKDAEAANEIETIEIDGITFAFLNYTYGINAGNIPSSMRGKIDMLCAYNPDNGSVNSGELNPQVIEDIKRADQMADYVIVCPHWGTEYTKSASSQQKNFATAMTEAGADIIIGTHPHVVQPIEWIEAENGNRCLCYYSLGNYVSSQKNPFTMLEGMAWISIHVTEDGHYISDERTGIVPLVNHYTAFPVRYEGTYLLEEYTEEQAAGHGIKLYGEVPFSLNDVKAPSDEILGDWILTREQVLNP